MRDRARSRPAPATSVTVPDRRPQGRTAWLVFLWLALFYTLGTSGRVYTPDGAIMGRVTYSIVHGSGLAVDPTGIPEGFLFTGRDLRLYDKYGAGLSLISVPHALLGMVLHRLAPSYAVDLFTGPRLLWYTPSNPSEAWHFFAIGLVSALLTAATCAFLYAFLYKLGFGARPAILATAVMALASPLWPYAKDYFAEPLGGLGLVGFAWAAESMKRSEGRRQALGYSLLSGFFLGLSVLAKIAFAILFPAAAYVLLALFRRLAPDRARLRLALAFLGGGLAPCLVVVWYNLTRSGSMFTTGYEWELGRWTTPILEGLYGLILSPGHGLIAYFPALLVALACTRSAYRRTASWTVFAWASLILLVGFYCRWYAWHGGWCWGPRFLLPVLPFLAVPLATFFSAPPRSVWLRGLVWAVVLAGSWIAFTGTLVSSIDYHLRAMNTMGDRFPGDLWWSWRSFPAFAYLGFAPKGFYLVTRTLRSPAGWWLALLFGFGLVWLIPLARTVWRSALSRSLFGWSRRERIVWNAGALALGLALAGVSWTSGAHVQLQYDFEAPEYGPGWRVEGTAFGSRPCRESDVKQQVLYSPDGVGAGLVNTFIPGGDAAQGVLRSPEFAIRGTRATFLLGGADDIDRSGVRLIVEGQMVLRATGTGEDNLISRRWDLTAYQGRRARLELFDRSSEPGGHLLFDDFRIYR
jgi:hypothetical protein